jgi:hypothetical protein
MDDPTHLQSVGYPGFGITESGLLAALLRTSWRCFCTPRGKYKTKESLNKSASLIDQKK